MYSGLKTKLRALEVADSERIALWRNDESIQSMLIGWHWPVSVENEAKWIESSRDDKLNKRFAIIADDGNHIGNIGIYGIDWVSRQCGFGLFIGDAKYRGKGYANDASKVLLDFVFSELGMNRVWVYVLVSNEPSKKHFERLGFSAEGILKQHNHRGGEFTDVHVMGLLKGELIK
ncbi:MAG TPA: GNAT family N-acetyltransferase [Caldisericia bacterium]|nr:GNAT family N-acetyltransferase [Caldisericia bacterium]HPF48343.1 GNAT family N-acetyltransferase [Caldisericia bacterium]HPI83478.1 GNAT family N-acetyltransferase [Caldisericia bacterium]HPQ92796.1 GNAT family N-acetyltransferase [Caldisericia bacterium]HRV74106.1 GNAT family N-acetyltransferase [Caldisericia bacterium]